MAAAVTQTTHIRFKRPEQGDSPSVSAPFQLPHNDSVAVNETQPALRFWSVPVVYPLLLASVAGLLLWFVPAQRDLPLGRRGSTRRRRRRK